MYAEITSVWSEWLLLRLSQFHLLLAGQHILRAAVLVYDECFLQYDSLPPLGKSQQSSFSGRVGDL